MRRLRRKAGEEGISVEEAHRRLLRRLLLEEPTGGLKTFKEYLMDLPDPGDGVVFERSTDLPRVVELD